MLKPKYAGMTVRCRACRSHFDVARGPYTSPVAERPSGWSGSRIDVVSGKHAERPLSPQDEDEPDESDLQTVSIDPAELQKLRESLAAMKDRPQAGSDESIRAGRRAPAATGGPDAAVREPSGTRPAGSGGGRSHGQPRGAEHEPRTLRRNRAADAAGVFEEDDDRAWADTGISESNLPDIRNIPAVLIRRHGAFWLAFRGLLAVGLTLAFYSLAIGLAGTLLGIVYFAWQETGRIHAKVTFFCLASAGYLLWALIPRREAFEPPGPELNPEEEPELHSMIADVAEATGQRLPDEIYVNMEVNAGVTEYGGMLGFGRKRVLVLGLPLMVGLNEAELRGVLAHEFGHFAGHDTLIGPWLYASYMSLMRSIARFENSWMRFPFVLYAKLYFRVVHAVKREQEFQADAVAVAVVGRLPLKTGLLKLVSLDHSFMDFMNSCFLPPVQAGYRVAVLQGFARYLKSESHASISDEVRKFEKEMRTQPYDTHPRLSERLAAIDTMEHYGNLNAPAPALSVLRKPQTYEIRAMFSEYDARKYAVRTFLPWSRVTDEIEIPAIRRMIDRHSESLGQYTIESVPYFFSRPKAFLNELALEADIHDELMREIVDMIRTPEHESDAWKFVVRPLIFAVSLSLYRQGWVVVSQLGDGWTLADPADRSRVCRVQDMICRLFFTMRGDERMPLDKPRLSPSEWMESMRRLGIGEIPLSLAWDVPLPQEPPPPDDFAIDLTGA